MSNQLTQSTREEVFDEKGDACYFCEKTREEHEEDRGRDLDVHHLIPKRKGGSNDVENLIPVCITCHKRLESTQGDALGRIADKEWDREIYVEENNRLKSELQECKRELENAKTNQRANPLKELDLDPEDLLINIRSGGNYKRINFEIVAESFGTQLAVYESSGIAREQYEEWGSVLRKEAVTIPDAMLHNFIDEVLQEIRKANKENVEDNMGGR